MCSGVSDYLIYKWVKQNIRDNSLHDRSFDYLNIGLDHHMNHFIHNTWHQAWKGEKYWAYYHLTKFIPENHRTSNIDLAFLITWDLFPSLVTICVVVWKRQLLQHQGVSGKIISSWHKNDEKIPWIKKMNLNTKRKT